MAETQLLPEQTASGRFVTAAKNAATAFASSTFGALAYPDKPVMAAGTAAFTNSFLTSLGTLWDIGRSGEDLSVGRKVERVLTNIWGSRWFILASALGAAAADVGPEVFGHTASIGDAVRQGFRADVIRPVQDFFTMVQEGYNGFILALGQAKPDGDIIDFRKFLNKETLITAAASLGVGMKVGHAVAGGRRT